MKGLKIPNCTLCLKILTKGVQGFRISPTKHNIQIIRLMVLGLCILYIVYKRKRLKRLNSRNCLNILTMYADKNGYGLYIVYVG